MKGAYVLSHSVIFSNLDIEGDHEMFGLSVSMIYWGDFMCCESLPQNKKGILCRQVKQKKQSKEGNHKALK